jgi:hypothetical protein
MLMEVAPGIDERATHLLHLSADGRQRKVHGADSNTGATEPGRREAPGWPKLCVGKVMFVAPQYPK